jgi:UDP-N-acetylglucosamine acyltransferase
MIHHTAIVSQKAHIGANVKIGPYSIIEEDVVIGNDTEISSHCLIANGTRLGDRVKVFAGAVIGTAPQDLKYNGEVTYAIVGDDTVVREYATINKGTVSTGKTVVGKNTLIMTYCHIAHDCVVGDNVVISNVSQLAGHVKLDDWVVLGGMAKITQFCSVGKHAMVGADVKVVKDVAPFTLVGRIPAQVESINKVGLRRRGFDKATIDAIETFYDSLLFSGLNNRDGIKNYIEKNGTPIKDVQDCIDFITNSTRGIHR